MDTLQEMHLRHAQFKLGMTSASAMNRDPYFDSFISRPKISSYAAMKYLRDVGKDKIEQLAAKFKACTDVSKLLSK